MSSYFIRAESAADKLPYSELAGRICVIDRSRRFQKTAAGVMRADQRLKFVPQPGIAFACFFEKGRSFLRFQLERFIEKLLNLLPALRVHNFAPVYGGRRF